MMNRVRKEARKMELLHPGMRRTMVERQRQNPERETRSKQRRIQSLQSLQRTTSMSELEGDKLPIAIVSLKEYGFAKFSFILLK